MFLLGTVENMSLGDVFAHVVGTVYVLTSLGKGTLDFSL